MLFSISFSIRKWRFEKKENKETMDREQGERSRE